MARHLKTIVMDRLKYGGATFENLPAGTPHSRGIRYFRIDLGIKMLWGAMDSVKEGQKYKKRIVVRPSRFRDGLFELYTYHFPKTWSAACVANREMIKEAQRQAHALEHSSTPEALEWRIRFFSHYFNVVKGHAAPEPGMKRYSRFYQYTYVAIYRELQAAKAEAAIPKEQQPTITDAYLRHLTEEVTFEPVYPSRRRFSESSCISRASLREHLSPPRPSPTHPFSRYYANGTRLPISVSSSPP